MLREWKAETLDTIKVYSCMFWDRRLFQINVQLQRQCMYFIFWNLKQEKLSAARATKPNVIFDCSYFYSMYFFNVYINLVHIFLTEELLFNFKLQVRGCNHFYFPILACINATDALQIHWTIYMRQTLEFIDLRD